MKNLLLVSSRSQIFLQYRHSLTFCKIHRKRPLRECVFLKVSAWKHTTLLKKTPAQILSCDLWKILRLYTVLPHACFCSFPDTNSEEGELCQIYTNTSLLSWSTWDFHNKLVLDADLKIVTNKNQSSSIHDIFFTLKRLWTSCSMELWYKQE